MASVELYFALDVVSALLICAIGGFFLKTWRRTDAPLYLLFAIGFVMLGVSKLTVSASAFDVGDRIATVDALRVIGQTGGALVLALAYMSARKTGVARPAFVLGWTCAGLALIAAALYLIVPPFATLPDAEQTLISAHAVQVVALGVCVALSLEGARRYPQGDNLLVPIGFLFWAIAKYTWLLVDISANASLIPFVYGWRLAAIVLIVIALVAPVRRRP